MKRGKGRTVCKGTQERGARKHRAQGSAFFYVYTGGLAERHEHSTSKSKSGGLRWQECYA